MAASSQIVNAYVPGALARERRARWDFEEENPLRDARGFDLSRDPLLFCCFHNPPRIVRFADE